MTFSSPNVAYELQAKKFLQNFLTVPSPLNLSDKQCNLVRHKRPDIWSIELKKNNFSDQLGIPPLPSQSPDSIAALLWAREVLQQHLSTTYAVTDPKGIEELKSVTIGGIEQWFHIRGRNRKNPVLLYIHGGPGFPMIGFMDAVQRPWEDYFTVVHWDQRQTGKSYYSADDENNPLSFDRFVKDTEEVVQYLREHLEKDKLFILGHSWGSVLGMHMVKRHKDWIHAYIGVGQVVSMMDGERVLYERLCSHAREQNKDGLLAKLETIAPYPNLENPEKSFAENGEFVRTELSRLAGETMMRHFFMDDSSKMWAFDKVISPHLTLSDLSHEFLGNEIALFRSSKALRKEFMAIDLPNDVGSVFEVPVFFFTGLHDWHTPRVLSDRWFGQIESPHKELVHFKESCHFIVNEEPGRFLTALVEKVLPIAETEHGRETNNG